MIHKDGNFRSDEPVFPDDEPVVVPVRDVVTMLSPAQMKDRVEVLVEASSHLRHLLVDSPYTEAEFIKGIRSDVESHGDEHGQAGREDRTTDTVRSTYLRTGGHYILLEEISRADTNTHYALELVLPNSSKRYAKHPLKETVIFKEGTVERRVVFQDGDILVEPLTTGDIEDVLEQLFDPTFVPKEEVESQLAALEGGKQPSKKPLSGILKALRVNRK
jgi:hypothetical protein